MATGRGTSKAGAKAKAKSKAKAVKTAAKPRTKKAAGKAKPSATRPKAGAAAPARRPRTPIAAEPPAPAVPETAPPAPAAAAAAPTEVPDPGSKIKTLSRGVAQWLKENTFEALVFVIIGAAVGFLINAILMIFRYEGFGVPPGSVATGSGNLVSGSLFWIVFTTLVFSVIGYRRALGKERFWKEVREFPANVLGLFTKDRERAIVHLLWGFAGCIIVTTIISPSLGAVLALLILISLPSMLGDIITELLQRAWDTITKAVAPTKNVAMVSSVAMAVGVVGVCFALAFAFLFESLWGAASLTPPGNFGRFVKLLVAIAAGGAAYAIGRQFAQPTAAAALIFLAVMIGTLAALGGSPARADDGGWLECGGSLASYIEICLNTTGGAVALGGYSIRGSLAAALGAALGAGLGGALGSMAQPSAPEAPPGEGRPGEPQPPEAERARVRGRRRRQETDPATQLEQTAQQLDAQHDRLLESMQEVIKKIEAGGADPTLSESAKDLEQAAKSVEAKQQEVLNSMQKIAKELEKATTPEQLQQAQAQLDDLNRAREALSQMQETLEGAGSAAQSAASPSASPAALQAELQKLQRSLETVQSLQKTMHDTTQGIVRQMR
jgi:hypothetical protein